MKAALLVLTFAVTSAACGPAHGQSLGQSLGSVSSSDATVTTSGQLVPASNGRVELNADTAGTSAIVARDHTAEIKIAHGGTVQLCRTSSLHLSGSPDILVLGLDRGALEVHRKAGPSDTILTPDLRLTFVAGGPLDLRLRVSSNGDTCVENRGKRAPTLQLQEAFGNSTYRVQPGQHVLFEHGSLREVVDRETTPCGCPPNDADAPQAVPLAQAILHGGPDAKPVTPAQAAAAHPFPVAESAGLAPTLPPPPDAPGVTHTQVSTTIAFDPSQRPSAPPPSSSPAAPATAHDNPFRKAGRFFKRIFVR